MRGHEFGSTPQRVHSRTPSIDSHSEGVHYDVHMLFTTDSGLTKGWIGGDRLLKCCKMGCLCVADFFVN